MTDLEKLLAEVRERIKTPNRPQIYFGDASDYLDRLSRIVEAQQRTIKLAINFMGDGNNGPPSFYVDIFNTLAQCDKRSNAIARGET